MYSHTGEGSVSVINTSSIELDGRDRKIRHNARLTISSTRQVNSPNSLPPPPASRGTGLSVLPTDLASAVTHCEVPVVLGKSGVEEADIFQDIRGASLARQ
jgi:hypothetical protein